MRKLVRGTLITCCMLVAVAAQASEITVPMYLVSPDGKGKKIGKIIAEDSRYGLILTPDLSGLTPGLHGFHLHQNASCKDNGMAAGEHFDPDNTDKHLGPYNIKGHLGDLPALTADKDGNVTLPVLAPSLNVATIKNHALMIHAGGDNYSDKPPMGGGGARYACGVVSR